ncbi:MAG: hypothetical protein P8X74_14425 [Reinekea sp.]|jgi:hypothetical protein
MKFILFAIGGILFAFGLADLIGSFTGLDLWGEKIGVQLPELLWRYSAYLEMMLGYFAFKVASSVGAAQNR